MDRSIATADALTVAAADDRAAVAGHQGHHDADRGESEARGRRPSRDDRISHVFRTLGRGLVAEYDPA